MPTTKWPPRCHLSLSIRWQAITSQTITRLGLASRTEATAWSQGTRVTCSMQPRIWACLTRKSTNSWESAKWRLILLWLLTKRGIIQDLLPKVLTSKACWVTTIHHNTRVKCTSLTVADESSTRTDSRVIRIPLNLHKKWQHQAIICKTWRIRWRCVKLTVEWTTITRRIRIPWKNWS